MRTFLHGLFARLGPPTDGDPGDDQLLAAFVSSRDEAAFQQIVRRHGPMVHGVCRRALRNEADADDAFQAVFLVFVRKAASVRPGNMLGNWLHGVAVNVARKGREVLARRRTQELVGDVPSRTPVADAPGSPELREVIDQELNRLPADYRAAVVACDLEGRTRKEAAGQLGWSEGTVASRLARARAILADRLTRRGIVMPAAGLGVVLGVGSPAVAAIPRAVLTGHSERITELAGEALRAMSVSKLKSAAAVVLAVAGVVGVGTGVVLACGVPRLTVPPVSPAKPFPLSSVESKPDDGTPAAWSKPGTGADAATDKPGGANAGIAKPTRFILRNPERDITIVTDRDETFVEFFRRQRVMVAGVTQKDFDAALAAKEPTARLFVDYASYNEAGMLAAVYGSYARLAPISPRVADVVPDADGRALVLVADAKDQDVWHVAGFTTRSSVGFFTAKEKKGRDDFAPADLIHTKKK
jgi:RNA polymerase sigma factor (sigma-70 family)